MSRPRAVAATIVLGLSCLAAAAGAPTQERSRAVAAPVQNEAQMPQNQDPNQDPLTAPAPALDEAACEEELGKITQLVEETPPAEGTEETFNQIRAIYAEAEQVCAPEALVDHVGTVTDPWYYQTPAGMARLQQMQQVPQEVPAEPGTEAPAQQG